MDDWDPNRKEGPKYKRRITRECSLWNRGEALSARLLAEGPAIEGRNAEHPFMNAIHQTLSIGEN